MKYAKGPWKQSGDIVFAPDTQMVICQLSDPFVEHVTHNELDFGAFGWKQAMANGKAIVAVPDLIVACEAAAKLLAQVQKAIESSDVSQLPNEAQQLRVENDCWAAITLAKGKQE